LDSDDADGHHINISINIEIKITDHVDIPIRVSWLHEEGCVLWTGGRASIVLAVSWRFREYGWVSGLGLNLARESSDLHNARIRGAILRASRRRIVRRVARGAAFGRRVSLSSKWLEPSPTY